MNKNKGLALPSDRAFVAAPSSPQAVSPLRASIPSAWLPFRCRIIAGRATSDPEKLVTPGILYTSKREPGLTVRLVAIGWWDWHVSLLFAFKHAPAQGIEAGTGETREAGLDAKHESPVGNADAP